MSSSRVAVIVVAAGSGTRLGHAEPKAFVPLGADTILGVALDAVLGMRETPHVIVVVPAGARVLDYDFVMSNGFRGVDYNGKVGWIYDAYLTQ